MESSKKPVFENSPTDPALQPGAQNAVQTCLRIQPHERVTLITDEQSLEICAALTSEIREVGAPYQVFILEDYAKRPMSHMPAEILEDLEHAQVSLFVAQAQAGELKSRVEMTRVVNRQKIRHAHMVNITREIMLQGMKADFQEVDRLSNRLIEKARKARRIRSTSAGGTEIEAEFSPDLKWIKTSGIIGIDKWSNLPGGEIFTSPYRINGIFVTDGVVGDYLCSKYGDLHDTPLTIEIQESRITKLDCDNPELLREFSEYTSVDQNSNRVGEFAIGTNLSVQDVIGNILQDEKIPGVHIAFGHPYSEHTGQTWTSTTHIDCVGRCFDIWIDGEEVMRDGKFRSSLTA